MMLKFLMITMICTSVPFALWLAYRLGRKVCNLEWEEAIGCIDDPNDVRAAVHEVRRRMAESDDEFSE